MMIYVNQNCIKTQDFLLEDFKKLLKENCPLIGIDYGSVRIGLSLSNKERTIASPFKVIAKLKELDEIVTAKRPCGFVVGLPLQPDGTEGFIAQQVHLFVNRLIEKYQLPVLLSDERYTSKHVEEQMNARCMRLKKQRKSIDSQAAVLILQNILDLLNQKDSF